MKVWTQNVWSHKFFTYCQNLEYLLGMQNNSCPSGGCYFSPQSQFSNKPKHIYQLPTVGFELDTWHAVTTVFFPTYPLHWATALIKREQFGTTAGYFVTRSSPNPSWQVSGQYLKTRCSLAPWQQTFTNFYFNRGSQKLCQRLGSHQTMGCTDTKTHP